MKNVCILGISGNVGSQVYEVIKTHPDDFNLVGCSVHTDSLFLDNVKKEYPNVKTCISSKDGIDGLYNLINDEQAEIIVNCISGVNGYKPSIYAITHDKVLCVANKETIILLGDLMYDLLCEHPKAVIVPLDSEHSGLYQLYIGEKYQNINKMIITASGGPFVDYSKEELKKVSLNDAMKHPTWKMGNKISIDSATMFNKGLEILEVHYLFNLDYKKIEAYIERTSNVHALIEFNDGSIKSIMYTPSMKQPISFGISLGDRLNNNLKPLDLTNLNIRFEKIDEDKFKAVSLAYEVGKIGGSAPLVYCVANEVAVRAFIDNKISFLDIYDIANQVVSTAKIKYDYRIDDIDKLVNDAASLTHKIIERRIK